MKFLFSFLVLHCFASLHTLLGTSSFLLLSSLYFHFMCAVSHMYTCRIQLKICSLFIAYIFYIEITIPHFSWHVYFMLLFFFLLFQFPLTRSQYILCVCVCVLVVSKRTRFFGSTVGLYAAALHMMCGIISVKHLLLFVVLYHTNILLAYVWMVFIRV